MRKFKVKINDQEFFVEVEEIEGKKENKALPKKNAFVFNRPIQNTEEKAFVNENTVNKNAVYAQLPGTVVKILKNEDEVVSAKDAVLVLEAMKMENEVLAQKDGRIKTMYVKQGQKVAKGDILFEVE